MHPDLPPPNSQPADDRLTGKLHDAVEQARNQPVPADSRDRAVERARGLRRPRAARWGFALAGLAAAAAVVLAVYLNRPFTTYADRSEDQVARLGAAPNPEIAAENRLAVPDLQTGGVESGLGAARGGAPASGGDLGGFSGRSSATREGLSTTGGGRSSGARPLPASPAAAGVPHPSRPTADSPLVPPPPVATTTGGNPLAPSRGSGGGMPRPGSAPAPDTAPAARGESADPSTSRHQPGDARDDRPTSHPEAGAARQPGRELERLKEQADRALPRSDEARKLTEQWSQLSQVERAKQLEELSKKLPAQQRDAVRGYIEALGIIADRKKAEEKGDKAQDGKAKGGKEDKDRPAPQVFKRQGPPVVARVYVGDGNSLELVSLHVTVTVEGPRARTLVDHVFRNPHDRQLEGTFEYPLPTGASPSYFAMFLGQTRDTPPPRFVRRAGAVAGALPDKALAPEPPEQLARHVDTTDWGRLQEGRIVSQEKALETYEEVVRGRVDPALLEYAAGNTFRGRVFPIPPKGYNRVLLAYEELLPVSGKTATYRFPLPDGPLGEMRLALHARAPECKNPRFEPADAAREEGGSWLAYTRTWNGQGPGGDAAFRFDLPDAQAQAIAGRTGENGPLYLYARLRPDLKVQEAKPHARHAVFLLDTSLSEHPDRFARNLDLLQAILAADPNFAHFNVLTFNVGTGWVEPAAWLPNTEEARRKLLDRFDGLVLEGATDLGAALSRLAKLPGGLEPGSPVDVFLLSDGQVTWGEREPAALVAAFEAACPYAARVHCYRTGLGADNLSLFEALTRKGGGVFNCLTAADVKTAAVAHRRQCLTVDSVKLVGGPKAEDLLVAGRRSAVYPGGELVLAARLAAPGRTSVLVEGAFNGQKYAQEFPIEAKSDSELAPRAWGELAVASLLALNDPKLESLAVAYGQQFGIASRVASYLVLENEADYKRFNLEEERGKTLTGDLGAFLADAWTRLGKPVTPREAFTRFLQRIDGKLKLLQDKHVTGLLDRLADDDFAVESPPLRSALLKKGDVPPQYLETRAFDLRNVTPYIAEARRRADAGDADAAVRALSTVIEQHPGRGDALRLVGYRLLDLGQPAQAVRLFEQVQRQRPFEPHSYRDLARSLEAAGKYGLAAVQYEAVLAGTWHNRFGASLKQVALEEYAAMMREAVHKKAVTGKVADHFGERLEYLKVPHGGDLRVSISWNTDGTDVDLWVLEPDGTKVFYSHPNSPSGGQLSQDQTQGYGPERYALPRAAHGTYRVIVHYFRPNPNLLAGETHVHAVITRFAGTPKETVERRTVVLKKHNEEVEIGRLDY